MKPQRMRMPNERIAVTEKIEMWPEGKDCKPIEGYVILGFYDDGKLGEIFVNIGKEGELIRGLADGLATIFSIALQYGAPLETLLSKLKFTQFNPRGPTNRKERRNASSILDLIAHVIEKAMADGVGNVARGYFADGRGTGQNDPGVNRMQEDSSVQELSDGDMSE